MTNAQIEAKNAYLENQKQAMLNHWTKVNDTERKEILMHVNQIVNISSGEQKNFWLSFRNELANKKLKV